MKDLREKRIKKTLLTLFFSPFVAGFLTAMIVFKEPRGVELAGYLGLIGIWMIAAVASYIALKHYLLGDANSRHSKE